MARSKKSQTAHDKKVRQEAEKLKQQGFNVNADVEDFAKPKTIGGYRPDIIATKEKKRKIIKIIEVETEESKGTKRDKAQQAAFRQASEQNDNTTFRRVIAEE